MKIFSHLRLYATRHRHCIIAVQSALIPILKKDLSEARSLGIQHGRYEGNEAQLPATFILDEHQNILYAKYGIDSVDIPEHADLLRLV